VNMYVWLLGNGEHRSVARNVDDVASKPSTDSAFSLPPPSRASRPPPSGPDKLLPVSGVGARLRDDDGSAAKRPRIWSLAEVATSADKRPKRAEIPENLRRGDSAVSVSVSVEFRPWSTTAETAKTTTESRLGPWQAAFLSAGNPPTTTDTRPMGRF